MTKRAIASALLALTALAPATGARAASSLTVFRLISVGYQSGSTTVAVGGLVIEDLTGNNPPILQGNIYVSTQAGTDFGTGPMNVVLDPLGTIGRVSGTVTGSSGQLSADLVFVGTQINSSTTPNAFADVAPDPVQAIVSYFWNRFGHAIGSASSAFSTVNVPNAGGLAATGIALIAP